MSMLLGTLGAGLAVAAAAVAGFEGLYRSRDRGTIHLDLARRTPWQELEPTTGARHFMIRVPFVNDNALYEQTLVDVRAEVRVLTKDSITPQRLAGKATVRSLTEDYGRTDGYWPASLIGPNESSDLELRVDITGEEPALERLHAAVVSIRYQTYGRGPLLPFEQEIVLPLSTVKPLPEPLVSESLHIQCVPTPVLTDADDIVDVIDTYTRDFRQPGDIVTVAESVVAITQRQYFRPTEVHPGFWASRLCYFVPSKGSLSSRHGFQVAMNQIGAFKMVSAFFVGFLAKLVGKKGVFYTLAGRPAELIDDITGTMAPFDKYIVAGPKDPERVVARIKERTGMEAAIVDANDLKRAMVLAWTPGVRPEEISRMVLDNPFGNAAQQTPIVVLRRVVAGVSGSAERDQSCSV